MGGRSGGLVEDGRLSEALKHSDKSTMSKPMPPLIWKMMIVILVLIYGSYTILVHICEKNGKLPFSSASLVLLTEVTKLSISVTMLIPEIRRGGVEIPSFWSAIPYCVPAILYFINNNAAVHMQLQMDPATYQVLGNMKILSTAILYRLIIKRPITGVQWVSLFLLAVAGGCDSYGGLHAKTGDNSAGVVHITVKGLVMISTYCFISGLAGVYSEYILKGKYEMSIHLQNSLLYIFGIILNGSTWLYTVMRSNDPDAANIFKGYSIYTWAIIISQALCGLFMSSVMKHGSNITRLFIISSAMMVTMALSMIIFHLQLNVYIITAFVLVLTALWLYHQA